MTAEPESTQDKTPLPDAKGKKALVIDDDPVSLELIKGLLENTGMIVLTAKDGQEGLQLTAAENPHVAIVDVIMPGMDGFNFLKEIKKAKTTQDLPILIISARKNMSDSFIAMGADCFMPKPIEPEEFIKKVSMLALRSGGVVPKPQDKTT